MRIRLVILLSLLLLLAVPAVAQDTDQITDDDVNAIAKKMYCPVCENIPLDTCGTAACEDWRNEIRLYLENGMSEDEIIDDFIVRFGERVVGVPQDPTLNALSLVTPWVIMGLVLVVVVFTLVRWSRGRSQLEHVTATTESSEVPETNTLHSQLERDLGMLDE